ncbi:MAG: TetR/AcrR family transcriptional regulator [Hyphomonadaceae bacterium]
MKAAAKRAPTRERLIEAAKALFQARGYHGVGLAEILAAADAPKGSLYHHFPGGKDELAAAAVGEIAADVKGYILAKRDAGLPGPAIVQALAKTMAAWMARGGFRQSPLIAALSHAADADTPKLAGAVIEAYSSWRAALSEAFAADGHRPQAAQDLANAALASLEGAAALARAARSGAPLLRAGEHAARLAAAFA